jgi:hypothetical protein
LNVHTAHDSIIEKAAIELFDKHRDRRRPIRLIGVRVGDLRYGGSQPTLFDNTAKETQLLSALDEIRKKFGRKVIGKG